MIGWYFTSVTGHSHYVVVPVMATRASCSVDDTGNSSIDKCHDKLLTKITINSSTTQMCNTTLKYHHLDGILVTCPNHKNVLILMNFTYFMWRHCLNILLLWHCCGTMRTESVLWLLRALSFSTRGSAAKMWTSLFLCLQWPVLLIWINFNPHMDM